MLLLTKKFSFEITKLGSINFKIYYQIFKKFVYDKNHN